MSGTLPKTASVAHAGEGAKLHAPAAERNADVLCNLLAEHAPPKGCALEIASGTGQHVARFAAALPGVQWHPTDVDPARLRSVDAHVAEGGHKNVAAATQLDATHPGWAGTLPNFDLIVLINLLHLISEPAAKTILSETAAALGPKGTFILYGPFSRGGVLTSDGDARFDAQLRAADPAIGYKDAGDVTRWLGEAGLRTEVTEMPANNLALIARKAVP